MGQYTRGLHSDNRSTETLRCCISYECHGVGEYNSKKQQATLKSSNACLVVNTDRRITANPPYFSLLIPYPYSPRLRYYNEITPILYNETSEEFVSAERCRHGVITQRRWRYDT